MTDLDRLLAIHNLCSNEAQIESHTLYEKLTYQLKKADSWDYYFDIFIKRCIDWGTDRLYKLPELEQNQKTPEDIEKIKNFEQLKPLLPHLVGSSSKWNKPLNDLRNSILENKSQ